MTDPTRREVRQLKRELKRAGGKRRRRAWKRGLIENPDEARHAEADFGTFGTASLNGLDHDATRRRVRRPGSVEDADADADADADSA